MNIYQKTIKKSVSTAGVSLHAGKRARVIFHPAPTDHGIVFRRIDGGQYSDIPARAELIHDTRLASVLQKDGVKVSTVEHLLSACAGLEVDNLLIEIDSDEVPIMDGSASSFVYLLLSAGIETQAAKRRFLRIKQSIKVTEGDKWAQLEPFNGFMLDFKISFNHPTINHTPQNLAYIMTPDSYLREIARARTFGFVHEVEGLRQIGLARGGSLDNAIVFDQFRMLNNEQLRFDDELVKHKILDAIGDLYLAGSPILGKYTAYKSGHGLNNQLIRAVLADETIYDVVTYDQVNSETPGIQHWGEIPQMQWS